VSHGTEAIGVVLTGQMDDGTAGLRAIKDCGGVAIVQDPETAAEAEMPRSALQNVDVDHCVPLHDIPSLLQRLVGVSPPRMRPAVPEEVVREVSINRGASTMEDLQHLASPSPLTCPDCGGGLWEMKDTKPLRYRCHTGHAYSSLSLSRAQKDSSEHALWSSVRALREREMLLRRMAGISSAMGESAQAAAASAQAERIRRQAETLQEFAESVPAGLELDTAA
jgi:two-component system chemotaxis response regulator CheB